MKLIEQSGVIIPQEYTIEGVYKLIELAARNCYKSEDKICDGSAKKMVDFLIKKRHFGCLRHGTVYLKRKVNSEKVKTWRDFYYFASFYTRNNFSENNIKRTEIEGVSYREIFITTNYLVLLENNRLDDLQYICEPTEHHAKRTTIKFTTSIAINRELQTHDGQFGRARAEESTRYCNYSKDKFNSELTFIVPAWTTLERLEHAKLVMNDAVKYGYKAFNNFNKEVHLITYWQSNEDFYKNAIKLGMKPQEARDILAISTKSTLFYTLFDSDWHKVFDLRTSRNPGAHPMMKQLMDKVEPPFLDKLRKGK